MVDHPALNFDELEIVKLKTGVEEETEISYLLDGVPCLLFDLDCRPAKDAAAAQGMIKDLELVVGSLKYGISVLEPLYNLETGRPFYQPIPENVLKHVLASVFISSIVTYWKCFASADSRNLQIPDKLIRQQLTPELLALHYKVKFWRNNWIAHAGNSSMESSKCFVITDPKPPYKDNILPHTSFTFYTGKEDLEKFLELAIAVMDVVRSLRRKKINETRIYLEKNLDLNNFRDNQTLKLTFHQTPKPKRRS